MKGQLGSVLLGAATLAALAGCATQDPLALPALDQPAGPGQSPYAVYGPYGGPAYGYGYGYGYNYGYGTPYRSSYDPYYNYYYRGGDPRYYVPGVVYVPVPVPCADANNDGRCDKRPHGDGHHGHDHDADQDGGRGDDGNAHGQPPGNARWPRLPEPAPGTTKGGGPRVQREPGSDRYIAAPGTAAPRVIATPPVVRPAPRPVETRPPDDKPRQRAPVAPVDREPRTAPGRAPSTSDELTRPR